MADGIVRVGSVSKVGGAGAAPGYTQDPWGNLVSRDLMTDLLRRGLVYVAGDADENDTITGATSYAATTPTLLMDVPAGKTAMPLWVHLDQAGTVAGGIITVTLSFDRVLRYSSGGTSESITHMRTSRDVGPGGILVYSTAGSAITAAAATDARVLTSMTLDQDVTDPNLTESPHLMAFRDFFPPYLVGPASFLVFTYAATTGPTWVWSLGFAAWDSSSDTQS